MIELPTEPVRNYLAAFGAAAIYAATCNGRPTVVAAAHDPVRSIAAIENRFGRRFEPSCVVWLPERAQAERVVQRVRRELPAIDRQLLDASADEAERSIRAALRGVMFAENATVMERAKRNAQRLDLALMRAQARGDLKFFTRAYRAYRLQAQSRGDHVLSYAQARNRLQRVLVEMLSEHRVSPAIVERVLPAFG